MPGGWSLDIQDPNGASTVASDVSFKSARMTWSVEGPGSVEVDLRDTDVSPDWTLNRLVVNGPGTITQTGSPLGWAGYLTDLERSGAPDRHGHYDYKASGLGLAWILDRRIVRHATTLFDEAAVLVEWLLDEAQTQFNGDMGLSMGIVVGTTVIRLRNYCFGVVIGDAVRELASIARGFDWEVDYLGALNIWNNSRGGDSGFDLYDTQTQDWNPRLETADLLTTVSGVGDPSQPFGPRHDMVRTGLATTYGRREIAIDVDSHDLDEIIDAASAELKAGAGGHLTLHTMWVSDRGPNNPPPPWDLGEVWLQDKVTVHLEDCFGGTQVMRCTDVTVTLDPTPGVYFIEHSFDALVEDIDITTGDPDEAS